jgi:carboxyl-terminal processing protease
MHKKKLQVWLPLLLSLMMIAGMFIGYKIKENMPGRGFFYTEKRKPVQEVINLIENKYVDKVGVDSLADKAIEAILTQLDPHSVFIPATHFQDIKDDLNGEFYGIGIEYKIIADTINIINVLKGGPSEKAGLAVGDQMIKVGDSVVAGVKISSEKIKKFLRGSGGSKIAVKIYRRPDFKTITVSRGMIPVYSVDAAYMLTPTTGYIRLNKFSENTYKEFMTAAEKLKKAGMTEMVLDLRDNGGGILTQATDIADEFLSGDKLITYTDGKHSSQKKYTANKDGIFETGKLVVLVDESSASASEVLSGALQDWDRATIVGRRTFGKGLVQEQFDLSDGSGVRLTVARYYTPLGRSIQKSYGEGADVYNHEVSSRYSNGEVYRDSIRHASGKQYKTKNGKTVYGGGGISPDIFVPLDSLNYGAELSKAYVKGTINDFVYINYILNKSTFSAFSSPLQFEKQYKVDDKMWDDLNSYAKKDSVNLTNLGTKEKLAVAKQIKLLTARQIWNNEGLFEVSNAEDEFIKKALEVLKN